jgi:hypothetical protein
VRPWVCWGGGLVLLAIATPSRAQEQELRAGLLRVKQATVLKSAPGPTGGVLRALPVGASLRWIEGQKSGAFMRVVGADGPVGWVASSQVEVVESLSDEPATAQPPCKSKLADCKPQGCAQTGTDHALLNRTKRKAAAAGPAVTLTFPDFIALQGKADALVGQGNDLDAAERAKLKQLTVGGKTVGEGKRVRVVGFLATGIPPHDNKNESVNCRLTGKPNNDFHLALTRTKTESRHRGIVAEMIPQGRPPAWTLPALATIQNKRRRVMVEGNLFYDNVHVVNSDAANPIGGQPARSSLWEIHRIARFWSCEKPDDPCDPTKPAQWKELK